MHELAKERDVICKNIESELCNPVLLYKVECFIEVSATDKNGNLTW